MNLKPKNKEIENSLFLFLPVTLSTVLKLDKQEIIQICAEKSIEQNWDNAKEKTLIGKLVALLCFLHRQEEFTIDHYGSDEKGGKDHYYSAMVTANNLIFNNHKVEPFYLLLKALGFIDYDTGNRPDRKIKTCRLVSTFLEETCDQVDIAKYLPKGKVEKLRAYFYPYSEEERSKWRKHHQWLFNQIKLFKLDSSVVEIFDQYPDLFKKAKQKLRVHRSIIHFRSDQQIFKPNPKGVGRVFNSISSMKREQREYLRLYDQKLVKIDITAAQPYFITSKFKSLNLNNEQVQKEVSTYWNLYKSGDFYSNIYKLLYGKELVNANMNKQQVQIARDKFKLIFFGTLISGNPYHVKNTHRISKKWTELRVKMEQTLPNISNICDQARNMDDPEAWTEKGFLDDIENIGENRLKIDSNAFTNELQRLEAKIIIDGVCDEIYKNDKFPVCPVHDCIITEPHNEQTVVDLINKHCLVFLDQQPNISAEGLGFSYQQNYK